MLTILLINKDGKIGNKINNQYLIPIQMYRLVIQYYYLLSKNFNQIGKIQ